MDLFFIGITTKLIGEICIAYAVLSAHATIEKEHKIDEKVIMGFHREKFITIIGIFLIIIGYLFEVEFFGGFEFLLNCEGVDCVVGGE